MPLIVYPVKDENPLEEVFDPNDNHSIQKHLDALYKENSELLNQGDYHVLFIWQLNGHRMTDVWIHDMENWSDSGPMVKVQTFNGLDVYEGDDIASGDSLIALGREEELRRQVGNLERYVNRSKHLPDFPRGMEPTRAFYERT